MQYYDMTGNGNIVRYTFDTRTANGEELVVDLVRCKNPGGANAMPHLWYKAGKTPVEYSTWVSISTYATDAAGDCRGRYNPQVDGNKLCFDWVLPDTDKNRERIIAEIARRAGIDITKEQQGA